MEPGGVTLQLSPHGQISTAAASGHARLTTRARAFSVVLIALCISSPAFGQISLPKDPGKSHENDEGAALLRQMVEAYSHLPSLQQQSVYTSTLVSLKPVIAKAPSVGAAGKVDAPPKPGVIVSPAKPGDDDVADDSPKRRVDRTVDLLYVQPNLLRITDSHANATGPGDVSKWVSDGKFFSVFVPKSHNSESLLYTKEKAPRNIHDFVRLQNLDGNSLELVMLMGINPFQNLTPDVATVRVEESATVRGVDTQVVSMLSASRTERDLLYFYIGKSDHLLHRFVSEVSPIDNKTETPRIGDALDDGVDGSGGSNPPEVGQDPDHPLDPGDSSTGQRTEAKRTRVVYDNVMTPVTHVEQAAFAFTPPTGAALFTPLGSKPVIDPNSKRLAALIRKSMKGAKTKPVHDVTEVHEISP